MTYDEALDALVKEHEAKTNAAVTDCKSRLDALAAEYRLKGEELAKKHEDVAVIPFAEALDTLIDTYKTSGDKDAIVIDLEQKAACLRAEDGPDSSEVEL